MERDWKRKVLGFLSLRLFRRVNSTGLNGFAWDKVNAITENFHSVLEKMTD